MIDICEFYGLGRIFLHSQGLIHMSANKFSRTNLGVYSKFYEIKYCLDNSIGVSYSHAYAEAHATTEKLVSANGS